MFLTHIFKSVAAGNINNDPALVTMLLPENAPADCKVADLNC